MAYLISPSAQPPALPSTVVSVDGFLTAALDEPNAGVLLKADFSALNVRPDRVRLARIGGDVSASKQPLWGIAAQQADLWVTDYMSGAATYTPYELSRTNLHHNSAVRESADGWSLVSGWGGTSGSITLSRDTGPVIAGVDTFAKATLDVPQADFAIATGRKALGGMRVVGGQMHCFSAHVSTSVPASVYLHTEWFNNEGASIGSTNSTEHYSATAGWTRITYPVTAPASAAYVHLVVEFYSEEFVPGSTVKVSAIMAEVGSTPTDYFDASTPSTDTHQYRFEGETYRSASQERVRTKVLGSLPAGTGQASVESDWLVRSGNDAVAVGGVAYAYDREAPLGVPSTYVATPVWSDGSVGPTSAPVTVSMPAPLGVNDVWLKSITDSTKAVRAVALSPVTDLTYAARDNFSAVYGSPHAAGSFDVWSSASSEFTFHVDTALERKALQEVLTSGVVLFQTHPAWDIEDMYVKAGDVTRSRYESVNGVHDTAQTLSTSFTQVARPATLDAPKFIPGYSWSVVLSAHASWDHVNNAHENWASVLTGSSV